MRRVRGSQYTRSSMLLLYYALALTSTTVLFTNNNPALASAEVLEDGLEIETTHEVDCDRRTQDGDNLRIHYKGTLEDGTVFDSSYDRGRPLTFELGAHRVIPGWDEGLVGMCEGEKRKLIIPPALAYGSRPVGPIPADSTLIFETELINVVGVMDATPPAVPEEHQDGEDGEDGQETQDDQGNSKGSPDSAAETGSPDSKPASSSSSDKSPDDAQSQQIPGTQDGECRLLGPFSLIVQGGLGLLALLSLVWKRYRERPRRPVKIWFFDVSKQVFGSVLLHMANLLMSIISSGDFEFRNKAASAQLKDANGRSPNPCSFYLLNLAIDTTIGIPILIILLRLLHYGASLTPLARPLESIKSGHYGQPPRATWWLKQSIIYFIGLLLMKLCVFFIFQILPWIAWVGDWALRWTEGSEALQITFVMFIFPVIMNAIQYYIIDSFIKEGDSDHRAGHEPLPTEDPGEDDDEHGHASERAALRRDQHSAGTEDVYSSGRNSLDPEARKREMYDEAEEEEYEYDDDDNNNIENEAGNTTMKKGSIKGANKRRKNR